MRSDIFYEFHFFFLVVMIYRGISQVFGKALIGKIGARVTVKP